MKRLSAILATLTFTVVLLLPVAPSHASDSESLCDKGPITADLSETEPMVVGGTQGDPDDLLGGNGARGNPSGISSGDSVDDLGAGDSSITWILGLLGALSGLGDQ